MRRCCIGMLLGLGSAALLLAATGEKKPHIPANRLEPIVRHLSPLHQRLGKPKPGDWLARFKEPGQTFRQYYNCNPTVPTKIRNTLYIQPIGDFTKPQMKIITLTTRYLGIFYDVPVKTLTTLPLSAIPASARRQHPSWGMDQILSTYVLDTVLKPHRPKDACALIAFTASDLWPGEGWNFVFGQASLRERVGVWSIYRNGDPGDNKEAFLLCLRRTLKTGTHETGHMFSIKHCTAYECGMCGCNHREESDRRPLWFCTECMAKVCWATRVMPVPRFRKLSAFCATYGLKKEAEFYQRCITTLTTP